MAASAQEERPEITPLERKVQKKKKEVGPRAVALLQLAANGKASLVPIAILIDGKFWDATAYKADPVPMALDSGTVYEAERSGNSLGLFTVGSALHSNAVNAPTPWLGTGVWHAGGREPETKPIRANTIPVGIEETDGPPRLTRSSSTAVDTPPAKGAPSSGSAPASTTPATASSAPKSTSSHDSDEPPRLTKGTPAPSSAPPAAPPSSAPGSSPPTASRQAKPGESKPDSRANIPASDSGASEANRPILRRGKPVESFADEDIPGYSKPGSTPSTSATTGNVETAAAKSDVQLIPAISDAGGPEARSFTFEWLKDEEGDRRKQMIAMAKEQLHAYLAAQAKARITPKPARPVPARRAAKPAEPIFENEKMVAYDLWNSNQPIIVFSADAHMPPPPAGTPHSAADTDLQYSIVLVAYPDIYNNLHKLYSGVTDKFHLDVTPRLELIDAVDADGDGRGELLFRETSDAGSGWVVYRATADKLWKLFDSLNPE